MRTNTLSIALYQWRSTRGVQQYATARLIMYAMDEVFPSSVDSNKYKLWLQCKNHFEALAVSSVIGALFRGTKNVRNKNTSEMYNVPTTSKSSLSKSGASTCFGI
jgi:hypothetical protein